MLETYQIVGSPEPAAPSPSSYGSVHFTPIGGFDQILTASIGVTGDYIETDSIGTQTPPGWPTPHRRRYRPGRCGSSSPRTRHRQRQPSR